MKTEMLLLLGVGAYLLYTKSASAQIGGPGVSPGSAFPSGSRSTGSGGTIASGGGMGTSVGGGGIPIGGTPGGPTWDEQQPVTNSNYITCPDGTLVNDPSLCPGGTPTGITYTQCMDGSYTDDPATCPENQQAFAFTCADGSGVSDPSLCPENQIQYVQCEDGSYVEDASLCPEASQWGVL